MNWAIRIALILVILGGLLWLNLDHFSETVTESGVPNQASSEPGLSPSSVVTPVTAVDKENPALSPDERIVVEQASEQSVPQFDLQQAPETLDQSDGQVRAVAEELSPGLREWLVPEEQLRKWTSLVKQAAEGKTMYQDRPFTINLSEFQVEKRGERLFISPENFKRYDAAVSVLVDLPAEKMAAYYRAWYPLWEKAFAELGLPGSFDEQVDIMLDRILAVTIIETPIELKKPTSVTYKFMESELEKASQIEKWLWRMGPENARKIQAFAGHLKQVLAH